MNSNTNIENNLTDMFIDNLFCIKKIDIPERITEQAKMCFIDFLGVTLAGAKTIRQEGGQYLGCLKNCVGTSTVINFDKKTDIYSAILINGLSSHTEELDDGHRFGMMHLGSPIIAALLSTAELYGTGGEDFIRGIITGYEAAIRLACCVQPSHKKRGYHTTGTCGTIGAAMGIAAALDFTREQTKVALSAAVTSAAGVLEVQEDSSGLKPYNSARASLDGFVAAVMGQTGVKGPDDILGGKRGFLAVMADNAQQEFLTAPLDGVFAIEGIYMKKYASCRHSHPAIEAALNIKNKYEILPAEIEKIKIFTYDAAVEGHDHKVIRSTNSAKMSTPYSVAVAIETGNAGITEFATGHINNISIKAIINKIEIFRDKELTLLAPGKRVAAVEIVALGKTYRERVDYPKGEPENPMTLKDIEEKFVSLAFYAGKTQQEAELLIEKARRLEKGMDGIYGLL